MSDERHDSDAGDANMDRGVAADANNAFRGDASGANATMASPNSEPGGADVAAAISDKLTYSLTIEDAQERFARSRRKVPSVRSLQRYCEAGLIAGVRTPVTYADGNHATPWFINDASLEAYIKKQPIVVLGDAADANSELATPSRGLGDASPASDRQDREVTPPASPQSQIPSIPLSDVLLENARLQERLDGKNEIIKRLEDGQEREREEWHSERDFLRTDITETRALVRDFKSTSDRILDTFKLIGSKQIEGTEKVEPGQILYKPVQPGGETHAA